MSKQNNGWVDVTAEQVDADVKHCWKLDVNNGDDAVYAIQKLDGTWDIELNLDFMVIEGRYPRMTKEQAFEEAIQMYNSTK